MVKNQSAKLPLANRSATWDKFSAAFKNYLRVHHISQVWTKANAPGVAPERLPAVEDEQELAAFVAKTPLTVHIGLDSGANLSARTCSRKHMMLWSEAREARAEEIKEHKREKKSWSEDCEEALGYLGAAVADCEHYSAIFEEAGDDFHDALAAVKAEIGRELTAPYRGRLY